MPNIIEFPSFTIKTGVSKADFLAAHEKFNREFVSVQNGYISHKLLVNDEVYSDLVVWETMEDLKNAFKAVYESNAAVEFTALIDETGSDENIPLYSVVKSY